MWTRTGPLMSQFIQSLAKTSFSPEDQTPDESQKGEPRLQTLEVRAAALFRAILILSTKLMILVFAQDGSANQNLE